MRECVQYLQSLRAIVDNPPPTPTRSLAKTKAPSIDKVIIVCYSEATYGVQCVRNRNLTVSSDVMLRRCCC
jgi:hypothetical protein